MAVSFEATIEVSFFRTTVRVWIDAPDVTPDVSDVKWFEDAWAQKIKTWLMRRWAAVGQDGTLQHNTDLPPIRDLFDQLQAIPNIAAAQIVEQHPTDPDIQRGFLVNYVTR